MFCLTFARLLTSEAAHSEKGSGGRRGCISADIFRLVHNRYSDNVWYLPTAAQPPNAKAEFWVFCIKHILYSQQAAVICFPLPSPLCSLTRVYAHICSILFAPLLSCIPMHSFLLNPRVESDWSAVTKGFINAALSCTHCGNVSCLHKLQKCINDL